MRALKSLSLPPSAASPLSPVVAGLPPSSVAALSWLTIVALLLLATPSVTLANTAAAPRAKVLDSSCTVSMLNRSVQAGDDSTWTLNGVPSFLGLVRARATCTGDDYTYSGQSEFFNLTADTYTEIQDIYFDDADPVPISLEFKTPGDITLNGTDTHQLTVLAAYSDGTFSDPLNAADGVNFVSSTPTTVEIDSTGLLKPVSSGNALIIVRLEGVLAFRAVRVILGGDSDGDGLDDSYELANGLDPSNPTDAMEDQDGDGLTALKEFEAGTNPLSADTDGDGLTDDEELFAGADGFFSSPLAQDTDGDGFADALESQLGTDPSDPDDYNLERALSDIRIEPRALILTYNSVDTESVGRIRIIGELSDGTTIDITAPGYGVHITSADLGIASFGVNPGEVFAGEEGTTTINARYSRHQDTIGVAVNRFDPVALSSVAIDGYANNVDVQGDYAYVAAGEGGLVVVNVSDRENPSIAGQLDTDGTAIDIIAFGNFVYLADGSTGIKIVDVSDNRKPVLVGQLQTGGIARDLALAPPYLYVAAEDAGVAVVSITDSANPILVGLIGDIGQAISVGVDGSRLAVATSNSLSLYDVISPVMPQQLSSVPTFNLGNLIIRDRFIYGSSASFGLVYFEISQEGALLERTPQVPFLGNDLVLREDKLYFAAFTIPPGQLPYVNFSNLSPPEYQGIINFRTLTLNVSYDQGTGIAADSQYLYSTNAIYPRSQPGSEAPPLSGDLVIMQYRSLIDSFGNPPEIALTSPSATDALVEGQTYLFSADASDDVAVDKVEFSVDGQVVLNDSTEPYQASLLVPLGVREMELSVRAFDLAGDTRKSDTIRLSVQADSDSDGLGDGEEKDRYLTQANNADSDEDGAEDGLEVRIGTDPLDRDTDGDGISDGDELDHMTDPLNPDVKPPIVSSVNPVDGKVDVAESIAVNVRFNERVSRRNILNALTLTDVSTDTKVIGSIRISNDLHNVFFEPDSLLQDFTEYRLTLAGISDLAGNLLEPFSSTFTTGNLTDTEKPFVVSASPANNTTDIAVSSVVNIVMSEPVKRESLNAENVFLYDFVTRQNVPATLTLNETRDRILLIPNRNLAVGRYYRLQINNLIDLFENTSIYTSQSFTTSFIADEQPPRLVDASMADGQQGVPLDAWVEVLFDERIDPASTLKTVLLDANGSAPTISRSLDMTGRRLRLHYEGELMPDTAYVLRIEGVSDTSGNVMSGRTEIAFTTSDVAERDRFIFLESNLLNNQTNVPLNVRLAVNYSRDINRLQVSDVKLHDRDGNIEVPAIVEITGTSQLRITPESPLLPHHRYQLSVFPVRSLAGNSGTSSYIYFTTGDVERAEPLQALEWSVEDGYATMPVNGALTMRFSSTLDNVECPIDSAVSISDNNGANVEFDWDFYGNQQRTVLRLSALDSGWQAETSYTVRIAGLCDIAGNSLGTELVRRFSTGDGVDTVRPTVSSITPTRDATDVAVDAVVIWRFSEPVWLRNGSISEHAYVYAEHANNRLPGDYSWDAGHSTLTFTPSRPYPADTQLNVCLGNSAFTDLAGRATYYPCSRFTTVAGAADPDAPSITAIVPADGAVDIDSNSPIVIVFSEPVDHRTVHTNSLALYANGVKLSARITRSIDNRTITLTNFSIPDSAVISVVATGEIADYAGNSLTDFVSVYATRAARDTKRPTVQAVYPARNAANVATDTNVLIYFSEPVGATTLTDQNLHFSQNGVLTDGALTVLGDGRSISFTPTQPWQPGNIIQIFARNGIVDTAGNPLSEYQSLFRTAVPDTVPPILTLMSTGHLNDLPVNARVGLLFSKSLNPASVNAETVRVYDGAFREVTAGVTFELSRSDTLLELTRAGGWQPVDTGRSRRYRIVLGAVRATDASRLNNSGQTVDFYISDRPEPDTQPPTLLYSSPVDGASKVGANAMIGLGFSERVSPLSFSRALFENQPYSIQLSDGDKQVEYVPHRPFALSSDIEIATLPVSDDAGNTLAAQTVRFSTAAEFDWRAPGLTGISPGNEPSEPVPVNAVFEVSFDEAISPYSIHNNQVTLYDSSIGRNVEADANLSEDFKTIYLIPRQSLKPGHRYSSRMTVSDMTLRNDYTYWYDLTTADTADTAAPTLVATSIADAQTDVPTNAFIDLLFDEPVNPLTLKGVKLLSGDEAIPVQNRQLSQGNRRLRLQLYELLPAKSILTVRIADVQDRSGNKIAEPAEISFTTGPTIISRSVGSPPRSIAYNDQSVPLNPRIVIRLNQPVNLADLDQLYLWNTTDQQRVAVSVETDGSHTLIITPEEILQADKTYWLAPTINTLTGQSLYLSNQIYFTTSDTQDSHPPTIATVGIADGQTDVPTNTFIDILFDEPVSPLTLAKVELLTDGATIAISSRTLSESNRRLRIAPTAPLNAETAYTIRVVDVEDRSGNRIAKPIDRTFTTGTGADSGNINVLQKSIAYNDKGVPLNPRIVFSLNQPISRLDLEKIYLQNSTDQQPVAVNVETDGPNTLIITPKEVLQADNSYHLSPTIQSLTDRILYLSSQIYFITSDSQDTQPPTIANAGIADGQTDVPTNTFIDLFFDEPVSPLTLSTVELLVEDVPVAVSSRTLSEGNRRLRIAPTQTLSAETIYTIRITDIEDRSGNRVTEPVERTFTTGPSADSGHIAVLHRSIAYNDTGVPLNPRIVLKLTQPINRLDLKKIYLWNSADQQNVAVNVETDGPNTLIVTPVEALQADKSYQLYPTIPSLTGRSLTLYNQISFTTGDIQDTHPPAIANAGIANGQTDVPTNTFIDILFDEPVSPLTLSKVELLTDGATVAISSRTLSEGNRRLRITPTQTLNAEVAYTIRVADIEDRSGNRVTESIERTFTTGTGADSRNINVLQRSIAYNDKGVPLNPKIVLSLTQPVNRLDIEQIYLWNNTDGETVAVNIETAAPNTLVITPQEALQADKIYQLYPTIRSLAGWILNLSSQIRFTTSDAQDTHPPTIANASIANGQTAVPTNAFIDLLFDEPVSPLNLSKVELLADGEAVAISSRTLSEGNRRMRLTPTETLNAETVYTIRIKDVEDRSGNRISEPAERTFTTGATASDYTLAVLHSSIAYNQQDVSLSPAITIEFNQPIHRLELPLITLWDLTDSEAVPVQIETSSPHTLVITPTDPLQPGRLYELRPTITSLSGRSISLPRHIRFRTAPADE